MNAGPTNLFHVARSGEMLGEKTREEILALINRGELQQEDLAWRDGMAEWLPISNIPELSHSDGIQTDSDPLSPAMAGASGSVPAASPLPSSSQQERILSPVEGRYSRGAAVPPLASLGARFLGAFADLLLFMGLALFPILIIDGPEAFMDENVDPSDSASIIIGILFLCFLVLQLVLLSTRGQSLGKILARTRIHLHSTGEQAGFLHAVLLRGVVGNLPTNVPFLGVIYWLVDLCFIFRSDRRCIHDLIGGTIVCKAD